MTIAAAVVGCGGNQTASTKSSATPAPNTNNKAVAQQPAKSEPAPTPKPAPPPPKKDMFGPPPAVVEVPARLKAMAAEDWAEVEESKKQFYMAVLPSLYMGVTSKDNYIPQKIEHLAARIDERDLTRPLWKHLEQGDIVVVFGATKADYMRPMSGNILFAYEKDAPKKGGYVATGSMSARKVTAEEFAKLTKFGKQK